MFGFDNKHAAEILHARVVCVQMFHTNEVTYSIRSKNSKKQRFECRSLKNEMFVVLITLDKTIVRPTRRGLVDEKVLIAL